MTRADGPPKMKGLAGHFPGLEEKPTFHLPGILFFRRKGFLFGGKSLIALPFLK
ncbi:MAG: hypothetical protein ACKN81_08300 [Pirellulaceae bacterium]